tara:strand:+ start:176 stop:415 length:240 start_codon:yes stop_codon:yes gene_type:complete
MSNKIKKAPENYFDMKGSVEKDKKVKMKDVFGSDQGKKSDKTSSKKKKKAPPGYHYMPDGKLMKDTDMKKKKPKKKSGY